MELPKMVWMKIDTKNKDLPLVIADTPEDLAELCGVTPSTVITSACRAAKGRHSCYIKVWIGDV